MAVTYAEQRKRVLALAEKWQKRMDLEYITFRHEFSEAERADDRDCEGTTAANWQYRDALFTWYLPRISLLDPDHVELLVVHELVHVLLNPIDPKTHKKRLEFVTESIARALIKAAK